MKFTERQRELIIYALSIMEGQCVGEELHYEIATELGGIPEPEEVRKIMDAIKSVEWIGVI